MRLRNFCRKAIPLGRGNCIVVVHGGLNERVCRDESDDNILAGALEGKVDVIVTGDKDLLVPKGSLCRRSGNIKGF